MKLAKAEAQNLLVNRPDDCTYEEIQDPLYVLEKVQRGLESRIARARGPKKRSKSDASAVVDRIVQTALKIVDFPNAGRMTPEFGLEVYP